MGNCVLLAVVIGVAGCALSMSTPVESDLAGAWMVEYIGERPGIDNSPAAIEFAGMAEWAATRAATGSRGHTGFPAPV